MDCPIKFGFMLFDDPLDPQGGWSSISGEKSLYVSNINDLSTDVLWWTNLSYEAMYIKSKVGVSASMRHDKYIILHPNECLLEWGYDSKNLSSEFMSVMISRIFNRIMILSWNIIVDACKGIHPKDVFSSRELRQDISRIFPEPVWPKGEAAAVCKRGYGFTDFTITTFNASRGNANIKLSRNRLSHALDILSTPIPDCEFEFISGRDIGENPREVVMNSKLPYFAEVSLKNIDHAASTVLAFGTSMDKKQRIMRTWVPHPELVSINPIADIEIKNAYVGKNYTSLVNLLPDSVISFLNCPFSFLSWTAGIIAETIWKSATLKNIKVNPDDGYIPDTSWRGLWIKSIDKTLTFISALKMSECGWTASYYGGGLGSYSCPVSRVSSLIIDGGLCGLTPKFGNIPKDFNVDDFKWKGDIRAENISNLTISNNSVILWNMDRLPTIPKKERKNAYGEIVKAISSGKI